MSAAVKYFRSREQLPGAGKISWKLLALSCAIVVLSSALLQHLQTRSQTKHEADLPQNTQKPASRTPRALLPSLIMYALDGLRSESNAFVASVPITESWLHRPEVHVWVSQALAGSQILIYMLIRFIRAGWTSPSVSATVVVGEITVSTAVQLHPTCKVVHEISHRFVLKICSTKDRESVFE